MSNRRISHHSSSERSETLGFLDRACIAAMNHCRFLRPTTFSFKQQTAVVQTVPPSKTLIPPEHGRVIRLSTSVTDHRSLSPIAHLDRPNRAWNVADNQGSNRSSIHCEAIGGVLVDSAVRSLATVGGRGSFTVVRKGSLIMRVCTPSVHGDQTISSSGGEIANWKATSESAEHSNVPIHPFSVKSQHYLGLTGL